MDRTLYIGRYLQSFARRAKPAAGMVALLDPRRYTKRHAVQIPEIHFRDATCEEVACKDWTFGWRTIVPTDSPQAQYIRHDDRRYVEVVRGEGLVEFQFHAGQRCFGRQHRVQSGEPAIFAKGLKDGGLVLQEDDRFIDEFNEDTKRLFVAKSTGSYTSK